VRGRATATPKEKGMNLEVNAKFAEANTAIKGRNGTTLLITPPLDADYFVARIPLSKGQSIVVFPKFGGYGCGFAQEEDWNTNLPISCQPEKIWDHIKHNRKHSSITKERGVLAIGMLQKWCVEEGLIKESDIERMRDR
jgi:hypothetical protein